MNDTIMGIPEKDKAMFAANRALVEPYTLGPDSKVQAGVPVGTVTRYSWSRFIYPDTIYPDTVRDYWVYVPQQYDRTQPACLMVFQDAPLYLGADANVPVVFDNLIHSGEMPVTIGLFVAAGNPGPGLPVYGTEHNGATNRSVEYDSLGDTYARFLMEEVIPEVQRDYSITDDPDGWAICGISSGGICAFTVAWERPDKFHKVVTHCGSFTALRGGNAYPSLIRKTPAKPLRVFLQSGTKDLNVIFGDWLLANQDMAAALAYRGYDYELVIGEGGHSLKHGGAIFPDTMRWLWRDYGS